MSALGELVHSRTSETPSATGRLMSLLAKGCAIALGFVREHTHESCTRLCALLCCLTGCTIGLATIDFAHTNPSEPASITALAGLASAFIAGGTVALLARTRKCFATDASVAGSGGGQ